MPIVVTCTNCDKKLRVPDDLLGKKVKCPGCGTIFLGKAADSPADEDKPPTSVRSKERAPSQEEPDEEEEEKPSVGVQSKPSQKGPRPKDVDEEEPPERPSRAGNKTKNDDDDEDEVPSRRRARKQDDDDDDDDDDDRPSRRRRRSRRRRDDDDDDYGRRRFLSPHRGSTILVLGILSFCFCGIILGPIAFFMGNADIAAMDAGTMDPSGRGLTNAGRICGLIGGTLSVLFLLLRIVVAVGNAH